MVDNIKRFFSAYKRVTKLDHSNKPSRLYKDKISLQLESYNSEVWIDCLKSLDRKKGYATEALTHICKLADKYSIIINLDPIPYGPEPKMNEQQLLVFYSKFGFKLTKPLAKLGHMQRSPK